jgi:transposase-like protein
MVATTMPRIPGSQSRAVMEEKEQVAIQLLAQGLTVSQISPQLKCSQAFVRRVRDQLRRPPVTSSSAPEQEKTA